MIEAPAKKRWCMGQISAQAYNRSIAAGYVAPENRAIPSCAECTHYLQKKRNSHCTLHNIRVHTLGYCRHFV